MDVRRMEGSPSRVSYRVPETMMEPTAGTAGVLVYGKEHQAREMEEQCRRMEDLLDRLEQEQVRRKEEHTRLVKELQRMKELIQHYESRTLEVEVQIADTKKALRVLKSGAGNVASVVDATPAFRGFKLPPFDGTSSWLAYRIQLEAVVKANGWTTEQARTALILSLRDQTLIILEALEKDFTYEQLLEALETRYGDAHLERAFRAQLRDRTQRSSENLQQWALEIEKLVRKAYRSTPALIDANLVFEFVDGIRDLEVRAAVSLEHHKSLKSALAHALEVESARLDFRAHRIREEVTSSTRNCGNRPTFSPRCYRCGEKGHLKSSCTKPVIDGKSNSQAGGLSDIYTHRMQENWRHRVKQEPKEAAVPVSTLRTGLSNEWKESLQQAQREDTDIEPIVEWLTSGTSGPVWSDDAKMSTTTRSYWAQRDCLVVHNGILCRRWEDDQGNHAHLQMIVPKAMVPEVLQLCHKGSTGGHLGVKRTLAKIRERFYWVHCKNDVKEWCRKCASCLAVKELQTRSGEMLQTDRIQRDHVDRVAPGTMV